MSFRIFTDTASNLPQRLLASYDIEALPLSYIVVGEVEQEVVCPTPEAFDGPAFYNMLRKRIMVKTSLVNAKSFVERFQPVLEAGEDLLFVGLSSGVSGTVQSARMAAQELGERFKERCIRVVDTLGASFGEGLQVLKAARLREAGESIDTVADRVEAEAQRMNQIFTVDDLMFLHRGGRLSGVSALLGTVLHFKPLLKGDEEGKIQLFRKLQGRKRSLQAMADLYAEHIVGEKEQIVAISHGDCLEDAQYLAKLIQEKAAPKEILIECHEPVTGAHVGPGMLGLFFEGAGRS